MTTKVGSAGWAAAGLRSAGLVAVSVAVLTASAKIEVPFYPVPMTLQTLAVVALALQLGARQAVLGMLAYLALGAMGLPVFAGTPEKGIGIAYMAGPTGGYLVGFVLASGLTGWLGERGWARRGWTSMAAALAGAALIYVPGLLWLGVLFGFDQPILEWGLYPFVLGDALKAVIAGLGVVAVTRTLAGQTQGGAK